MGWMTALRALLLTTCVLACNLLRAGELEERAAIIDEVQQLLDARDFDRLEALANHYRNSGERTPSGTWKLAWFHAGIAEALSLSPKAADTWKERITLLEDWRSQRNDTPTVYLAAGRFMRTVAWRYRGNGLASTVTKSGWKGFHTNIEHTREMLVDNKSLASIDPQWYVDMLDVANLQSWPDDAYDALFEEAVSRYPGYYGIYFEATHHLLPKWHGDAASIEQFARRIMRRTESTEGTGMYARIYWIAIDSYFGKDFPDKSHIDWSTMSSAMDDVLARHPDEWNIQNFASFSCIAGDKDRTAALLARMHAAPIMKVWRNDASYQACRRLAGLAPSLDAAPDNAT